MPILTDATADPLAWAGDRESEGWPGVAVADHLWTSVRFPHLWATLGAMAAATTGIGLASCFANNLFRHPAEFAHAAHTMQRLSGGRFEAGLGAGWTADEMEASGREFPSGRERARRYKEAMVIAGTLLGGEPCRFDGEFYRVDLPALAALPMGRPPLVASVSGNWVIRHVAPLADRVEIKATGRSTRGGALDMGVLASVTPDELAAQVGGVRTVAPLVPLSLFVIVAAGSHPAVKVLKDQMGDGLVGGWMGEPAAVAERIKSVAALGISRCSLTEFVPGTFEALGPYLARP